MQVTHVFEGELIHHIKSFSLFKKLQFDTKK